MNNFKFLLTPLPEIIRLFIKKGSFLKLNYDLDDANVNLVTRINKNAAINYLQNTILSRETRTDRVSSFLQQNLNENNDITLNFNIDPTSENIIKSLKSLYVASSGELKTNFIFDDNENPNFIQNDPMKTCMRRFVDGLLTDDVWVSTF